MTKKILAGLLALAMVLSVAGCAKDKAANSGVTKIVSLYVPGDSQAETSLVVEEANKIIEPALGVKLNLQFIDNGAYSEKMKMKMVSRDEMDVVWTGYILPYETLVENGTLLDITELLEKTPELKASIPDYAWETVTIGKSIYGVPNIQINANQMGALLRADLVEKYNFDISTVEVPDDLEPFFDQVLANESGIYPINHNFGPTLWAYDKYFMVGTDALCVAKDDPECKVIKYTDTPEYIHGVETTREWYKKGYIRSDAATASDSATLMNQGKFAVMTQTMKPGGAESYEQKSGFDVEEVTFTDWFYGGSDTRLTMLGVSTTSKQPEIALKLIEMLNTNVELYNLVSFGIEGKHYTKNEAGKIKYVDGSGYRPGADWKFGNQFNAYLLETQADDVWEKTREINENAQQSYLKGFIFKPDAVTTELANIATIYSEMGSVLKYGLDDPANFLESYESKLETAGLDKVQAEVQRQVDEYLANLE